MAYTVATLIEKGPPHPESGVVRLLVRFTGTGEATVTRELDAPPDSTAVSLRAWARAQAERLNQRRTFLDALTVPSSLDVTPPAAVPPTAKQVWLEKVGRYRQFTGMGLTGAGNTALTALLSDINATYATGFLDA